MRSAIKRNANSMTFAAVQTRMQRISRRKFLGAATATTAVFNFFPAHVLGLGGAKSPNEKLNVAGIGVAGQGGGDLDKFTSENIVALCDVEDRKSVV